MNNPFYGEKGAAYVFARQKGADDAMVRLLDEGLRNFAEVIKRTGRIEIDDIPGAGAAGGLGGGFVAFLKAELKPGIQMVLDALRRSCANELAWTLFLEHVSAFYEKFLFQRFSDNTLHL